MEESQKMSLDLIALAIGSVMGLCLAFSVIKVVCAVGDL